MIDYFNTSKFNAFEYDLSCEHFNSIIKDCFFILLIKLTSFIIDHLLSEDKALYTVELKNVEKGAISTAHHYIV